MKGILSGLGITIGHFVGKKVTRFYPYEKREMPPRTRGLIKLVRNEETGNFNCEACLFCEKICPPQCITIRYQQATDYRPRPFLAPNGVWGNFKRPVRSLLSNEGRPEKYAEQEPLSTDEAAQVEGILSEARGREDLFGTLQKIQAAIGYLPRATIEQLAESTSVPLSDVYSAATSQGEFRLAPATSDIVLCQCPACYLGGMTAVATAIRRELGQAARDILREEIVCASGECLDTCSLAPVLKVDGQTYAGVTPQQARQIVREKVLGRGDRQ
jgi:NADH:ubiquinone oxidoreductase subunit E